RMKPAAPVHARLLEAPAFLLIHITPRDSAVVPAPPAVAGLVAVLEHEPDPKRPVRRRRLRDPNRERSVLLHSTDVCLRPVAARAVVRLVRHQGVDRARRRLEPAAYDEPLTA